METEDKFYEKTLATTRTYTGKIVNVDVLDVELPDGRRAKREIVRRGNAVAILARRPDGKSRAEGGAGTSRAGVGW